MTRETKILFNFISYILLGFLICLIGLSNVFASTYIASQFEAKLFDNYGPSLTGVTTSFSNDSWRGTIPSMTANTSGAAWGFSSPIPIIANHTYAMSVVIDGTYGGNLTLSTYDRIGIGSSMTSAEESYENNTKVKEGTSKAVPANNMIQFVFTAESSASYIVFPFATTYSGTNQSFYFTSVIIDDLGSDSLTQNEINNSLNNQTNVITGAIGNIENNINSNIDNMEESINGTLNDSLNNCRDSYNLFNPSSVVSGYTDDSSGNIVSNSGSYSTGYIPVKGSTKYFILSNKTSGNWGAWYDSNKNYISGIALDTNTSYVITSPSNAVYMSFTVSYSNNNTDYANNVMIAESSTSIKYEPYGKQVCGSKIDETNDKLDNLTGSITSDNVDNNNVSNAFSEFENFIDENATISTLITLPVTLFSAILNGMQSSCAPFNLGSLYGEDLILPCINLSSYLGNTLWTMIDIIISGFAIFFISKKFVKVFNNFSSMKEGDVIDD